MGRRASIAMAAIVLAGAVPTTAFAHLTGVFAYFVQDIGEPTATTRLLRQQLDSSEERIAKLKPEIEAARAAYSEQAESVLRRLRFYDVYSGSAVGALWARAQDPVDVLASIELMQKRLDDDLAALARLEQVYSDIQFKEQTLTRYSDLLRAYDRSAQMRDKRLSEIPEGMISPFGEPYVAYEIAEAWETLRPTTFVSYFEWAGKRLAERIAGALEQSAQSPQTWELREEVLNTVVGGNAAPFVEDARFYLRADHVNFTAQMRTPIGSFHVLTIGQMERTGPSSVQYRIEGIFLDGMPIDPNDPDVQREVYKGNLLAIDLGKLLPEGSQNMAFEQHNGYLSFHQL